MKLQIETGQRSRAQRTVIYGPEGVGKSTLGAQFPSPLFIDAERGGTDHLNVSRVRPERVEDIEEVVKMFAEGSPEVAQFQSLVIDTIDWVEKLAIEKVCRTHKKSGLEDFGYGKGQVFLEEEITSFLLSFDPVIARGINVLFLAHSTIKTVTPPDMASGYDRYELKLTKRVSPVVKEWADVLLFNQYVVKLQERDGGKARARGGRERCFHTSNDPAWDAKHRLQLPSKIVYTTPEEAISKLDGVIYAAGESKQAETITAADAIKAIPEGMRNAALKFLIEREVLSEGSTLDDMPDDYAGRIVRNPDKFKGSITSFLGESKEEGGDQ